MTEQRLCNRSQFWWNSVKKTALCIYIHVHTYFCHEQHWLETINWSSIHDPYINSPVTPSRYEKLLMHQMRSEKVQSYQCTPLKQEGTARRDVTLHATNSNFEGDPIHRSRLCIAQRIKRHQTDRQRTDNEEERRRGAGASDDDTKSISPSRHALPISRMNGMFSSPLSFSLFTGRLSSI